MDYTFTWKIQNYLFYSKIVKKCTSPTFTALRSEWYLSLEVVKIGNCDYFSCFLIRKSSEEDIIFIDFTMEISFDTDGKSMNIHSVQNFPFRTSVSHGCTRFMNINKLLRVMHYSTEDTLTIRCYLAQGHLALIHRLVTENVANTFFCCNENNFKCDLKSDFRSVSESHEIHLPMMIPLGIRISITENYIVVKLSNFQFYFTKFIRCRFALMNANRVLISWGIAIRLFDTSNTGEVWKIPLLQAGSVSSQFLFGDNRLKSGSYILLGNFSLANGDMITKYKDHVDYVSHFANASLLSDSFTSLHNDLKRMLTDSRHCDVKFRVDDTIFLAHKSILAARSPVLCAMFSNNMIENVKGLVEIIDVDAHVFKLFLEFLYTGNVNLNYESATRLLFIADKYEVSSLVDKCAAFLVFHLSFDNVREVLWYGNLINHKFLISSTCGFIKTHLKEVDFLKTDHIQISQV